MGEQLPERAVRNVLEMADHYYDDHAWVRAYLWETQRYGQSEDPDRLSQDDRSLMMLVATRYESFSNKYRSHGFTPKQLVYAVSMMLAANEAERNDAIRDAQELLEQAQSQYQPPTSAM